MNHEKHSPIEQEPNPTKKEILEMHLSHIKGTTGEPVQMIKDYMPGIYSAALAAMQEYASLSVLEYQKNDSPIEPEDVLNKELYPESAAKDEYIICAAIWFNDGNKHEHQAKNIKTGFVVCGRRHHNCFATLSAINKAEDISNKWHETNGKAIQGFLTSKDRFLNRKESGELALTTGQIKRETNCLFSEDLY